MKSREGQKSLSSVVRHSARLITRTSLTSLNSIEEALRIYFQPIKKDDSQLDFPHYLRRETMEYDSEYTSKYDEPGSRHEVDFRTFPCFP